MQKGIRLLLCWVISAVLLVACDQDDDLADMSLPEEVAAPEPEVKFGFTLDSFEVVEGKIQPNQVMSELLLYHHIPYPEIDRLAQTARDVYSLRKIQAGKPYTLLLAKDSTRKAMHFIYEPSDEAYVVYSLGEAMNVRVVQHEITTIERAVVGVINSSLYATLQEEQTSPAIAMSLSEIYAWSIDFYRIQKGDKFKVIFEERLVGDKRVGVGKIKAAVFTHRGEEIYAFPFEQNGRMGYYDEKGVGLRKAFLQAPLKFGRISSSFTMKRYHPVQKRWKAHLGTDYAAPHGTPILAVGDGIVTEATKKKFNGNYVKIKHNATYTTQYLHMSKFAAGIKRGKRVSQGDVIGYVGSTGLATGPHVCFRFWKNGKQVDHRKIKLPGSLPVEPANMPDFMATVKVLKGELDALKDSSPIGRPELAGFNP
jgi:murein DD-endopeptidase MepM/ murein hydrolase activator NlpD